MRQLVTERLRNLRGIPPENVELKQQVQQMAQRVQEVQQQATRAAQMESTAQSYAQQTAQSARSAQEELGNLAQQAGVDVPLTPSEMIRPTPPNQSRKPTS